MVFKTRINSKEEVLEIDEIKPSKAELKNVKPRVLEAYFQVSYIISLAFCLVFLILIILKPEGIKDYMIGFVGTILGYFLAKRPYEL